MSAASKDECYTFCVNQWKRASSQNWWMHFPLQAPQMLSTLPPRSSSSCNMPLTAHDSQCLHSFMNLSCSDGRKLMRETKVKHVLRLNRFLSRPGGFVSGQNESATLAELGLQDICHSHTHRLGLGKTCVYHMWLSVS